MDIIIKILPFNLNYSSVYLRNLLFNSQHHHQFFFLSFLYLFLSYLCRFGYLQLALPPFIRKPICYFTTSSTSNCYLIIIMCLQDADQVEEELDNSNSNSNSNNTPITSSNKTTSWPLHCGLLDTQMENLENNSSVNSSPVSLLYFI